MRYLVTVENLPPFLTNWFDYDSHWRDGIGMMVYDIYNQTYTTDGKIWSEIEKDQL